MRCPQTPAGGRDRRNSIPAELTQGCKGRSCSQHRTFSAQENWRDSAPSEPSGPTDGPGHIHRSAGHWHSQDSWV